MIKNLWWKLFPYKELKAYRKMHRKHRKELVSLAKRTREYDWGCLHEMVLLQIKHMLEYYTANNEVYQCDESRLRIIEQLQHVLDIADRINKLKNDDFGLEFEEDTMLITNRPDDFRERCKEHAQKEQFLYEKLYGAIGEYIRWWWD